MCVNYVIPVFCESVLIVLKLYFNLFFDTDFISIDTIIIVSPSMKK